MMKVDFNKLEMLRKSMNLSINYLTGILNIDIKDYTSNQDSHHVFVDEQVSKLSLIFNVNKEYLEADIKHENAVFARSNGNIEEHDKIQIAELYEFQKMFSAT